MQELQTLKQVIKKAGQAAMRFYGNVDVDHKSDSSPVTQADLASETVLLDGLADFGYAVLSEESTDDFARLEAKRVWIMDPLDGTKDFIQQTGDFSIMVGLVEEGEVLLGAVFNPVTNRLYYASKGDGAFTEFDGEQRALQVSDVADFSDLRMLVSRNHLLELEQKVASNLNIVNMIPCGSAGLKSSLVAAKKADLYMNTSDKTYEWDICAADIIVKEAGGTLTDMKGEKIVYNKENPRNLKGFVVSNGELHSQIIAELKGRL